LEGDDELSDEEDLENDGSNDMEPMIWFGISKQVSKEELLSAIPPREISDRMVSYFMNSMEPIVGK
jgi:hypothetical protein